MSDKKRPDPHWNEIPTHPSLKKGRSPTPRPAFLDEKPEPEPTPAPPESGRTEFTPEERAVWEKGTKIPEELFENISNFLLMVENMKNDPKALAELDELLLTEFIGNVEHMEEK